MRKHVVVTALVALLAAPAVAQEKGSIEIGGFAKFTDYDKSFETSRRSANSYGGGGRLGYFFSPKWELELDGSANATDVKGFFTGYTSTALTYYPFHLRLIYNQKLGSQESPFTWLLGAGPAYNRYGKSVPNEPGFKGSDFGIGALTGFRANLTRWLAARLDGTLDYIPSPNNGKDKITTQATGISAPEAASKNLNLGVQLGLSIIPVKCDRSRDGTTIAPTTANTAPGGGASFSATATYCGKPDAVAYTVSGPGSVDQMGRYTAAGAGTATVTACGQKNKLCSTATVNVTAPPPPPPVRTMVRCELSPASSQPRIDQPVSFTVTGSYSDNTTSPLPNATIAAAGGSVSGNSVSWSTPGTKTITANCGGGLTANATADVQQLLIVVRDSVFFNVNRTIIYRQDDQTQLNAIAKVLIEHPDIRLVIDGHTDADASVLHNESLGLRRAQAMKDFLARAGAPVDRMTIVIRTFGECVPIEPNNTTEGRTQNRRAELREFGTEQPGPGNAKCAEAGRERRP
ncbi:MAG: OmpA family protein [Gemmatimonadales bacterium]|nr:OmpA family protein [Gemmatimonadales bacterium]